jgi:ADP-ribose pyrophosphatase YjhB (NUDIX family)
MKELPHVTVATIVERDGKFLMVKEKSAGRIVYNQPAGHLEPGETLRDAALRETLEETTWEVRLQTFLGIYQYTSAANGVDYVRHCFIAEPLRQRSDRALDPDILEALWMSRTEIQGQADSLRSPLVLAVIDDYLRGKCYSLELLTD